MTDAAVLPTDPDRSAATLLLADRGRGEGPYAAPGDGAFDARLPLKQLYREVERRLETGGNEAAREHFRRVDRPELRAGTIQDATARAVRVVLEETLSLCPADANEALATGHGDLEPHEIEIVEGKHLRRRREFLIASGGARVRFSRKGGVLFVDRTHDVHAQDCLRIEDRSDRGDLDGFVGDPDERPRLFSPAYLKPRRFETSARFTRLILEGRLGRRPDGYRSRMEISATPDSKLVTVELRIENRNDDHRLRLRVLGCRRPDAIGCETAPAFRPVFAGGRAFVATSLLRSIGRLRVDDDHVPAPEAQCHGTVVHRFLLGLGPWSDPVGGA